jgi:protein gp37
VSAETSIEWTNRTWIPVRGCALVSEGCRNCYAMKQAHRFSGAGQAYEGLTELGPTGPRWTGKIRTVDAALAEPVRWRKPRDHAGWFRHNWEGSFDTADRIVRELGLKGMEAGHGRQ